MIRDIICIECPKGCALTVNIKNKAVVSVSGNKCSKGREYAVTEIENPLRILTSAVYSRGLSLKILPVKTDRPIPKGKILPAMEEIKKIRVNKSFREGDIVVKNLLNLGVNLVATRDALRG